MELLCELPFNFGSPLATRSSAADSMEMRFIPMDLQAEEASAQFLCQLDKINQCEDYQKRKNELHLYGLMTVTAGHFIATSPI
jgi:hypothetical protein